MEIQSTQLNTFLITAQCSSFSAAAEKLFISHSALIQQMNALEKTLGFVLFHRTARGIKLTESGEYFYRQYQMLSKQMGQLIQECIRMEQNQSILRIGNLNDLHTFYFYSDLYRSFSAKYPTFSLEYVPTKKENVMEYCRDGKIDIGYYFGPSSYKKNDNLLFLSVNLELGILLSADHPLAGKEYLSADDLSDIPLYFSDLSYDETLYDQLPFIRPNQLHSFEMFMDIMYKKCYAGEAIMMPLRFKSFFPSLVAVPMKPAANFTMEIVSRSNPTPAVQKLLDFYLEYENQQSGVHI